AGDTLILSGAAPGAITLNLNNADQYADGTDALNQSGFKNANASAVTGNSVTFTGDASANTYVASNQGDTIAGGAGTDNITGGTGNDAITMDVSTGNTDTISAGAGSDTLILTGALTSAATINLTLADQYSGSGDALIQAGFENANASAVTGSTVTFVGDANANTY